MSWDAIARVLDNAERNVGRQGLFLLGWVALLWAIEGLDFILGGRLQLLGIVPRTFRGLIGIPLAPFLHGDFAHLSSNTLSLIPLGWVILMTGRRQFWTTSIIVLLLSGLGVWIFGSRDQIHIGASGLIFGYLAFLLVWGFIQRSIVWILVALVVGVVYGSMVWDLWSGQPDISWQGHVMGFLSGIVAALAQRKQIPTRPLL